jgi:hypothetical protein
VVPFLPVLLPAFAYVQPILFPFDFHYQFHVVLFCSKALGWRLLLANLCLEHFSKNGSKMSAVYGKEVFLQRSTALKSYFNLSVKNPHFGSFSQKNYSHRDITLISAECQIYIIGTTSSFPFSQTSSTLSLLQDNLFSHFTGALISPQPDRVQISAGKILASIFWDQDGILLIDYLPKGQTINAEYYSSLLVGSL